MATHFARGILSTGEPLSTRLSAACHQSARLLPTYRQARFCASRSLLAELLFMLYGISELPEIINEANGRPVFSDRQLPRFSIAYTGNIVGVALTTEGDCGLDMELQRTVRSHDADRHNFSNNENLWINIQHDPDEARSQLVALRRSVLKLTGEASTQLQLLPGSGRLRTAGSQPIEAVCDAESLLVWSIAATPNIGSLKVWEYDAKGGDWAQPGGCAAARTRTVSPPDALYQLTHGKNLIPQLTGLAGIMIQRSNHVRYLESGYVTRQPA